MTKSEVLDSPREAKREANTCIALGAGVGVFGATAAAVSGAVCPLCIVIAPGLIGYGAYRRWKARTGNCGGKSNESSK